MTNQKPEEQWEPIPGFKNYQISNRGKIRSITRKVWHKGSNTHMNLKGKMMKQRWNKACKCYFLDLIDDEGKRRTVYPHKEVAKAFVPNDNASELKMIIHIDNNPRNNQADNLQWMTPSEHMKWQFDVGNKNNFKVWKTRKKLYKNGFKPTTVLPGRPKKNKAKEEA
ncbi:MAG: NUMOD4 motif-containing HNH endonuclease [Cyclobacteriaceae bacterium]|nr:NUMOD4 motif-containing HNH endonuclease [Cyclobacteriaceae bacterium]